MSGMGFLSSLKDHKIQHNRVTFWAGMWGNISFKIHIEKQTSKTKYLWIFVDINAIFN